MIDDTSDLLFGIRAWRAGCITATQLMQVCARRGEQPDRSLSELLLELKWITTEQHDRLLGTPASDLGEEEKTSGPLQQARAALGPSPSLPLNPGAELTTDYEADRRAGGAQVGRYTLLREEGQGGMGKVYLALDHVLNREVALKELLPNRDTDENIRRFQNEARITGRLQHPGIVPVYDLVTVGTSLFYTMKYVQGTTLRDAVLEFHKNGRKDRGRFRALLRAFISLCRTMAYAHSQGVIHRDLKGANVILGNYDEVLVLDWGLAKELRTGEAAPAPSDSTLDPELTATGQVMGTPAFMAPEQAAGDNQTIGPASDVYGLGAILYQLLTGKTPFSGSDLRQVLARVRTEMPSAPGKHWPKAPASLQAVCLKALAKAISDRYASADALADDVQRWLDDEPVSVHRDGLVTRLLRRARRNRVAVTALGVLVMTALVALSVGLFVVSAQEQRARQAEQRATTSAATARANEVKARVALGQGLEAIRTTLTRLSKPDLASIHGLQPIRAELLHFAVSTYDEILTAWGDEPSIRRDAALGMHFAGAAAYEVGDDRQGLELIRRAIQLQQKLIVQEPDDLAYRVHLARLYAWEVSLVPRVEMEQMPAAQARAQPFMVELEASPLLRGRANRQAEVASLASKIHMQAGKYFRHHHQGKEAVQEYQQARRYLQKAIELVPVERVPAAWFYLNELSLLCSTAALDLGELASFETLRELMQASLEALEAIPAEHQNDPGVMQQKGNALNAQFVILANGGYLNDALAALEGAVAVRTRLVQLNPASPVYRAELGSSLLNRVGMQTSQGELPEALVSCNQAAEHLEKVYQANRNAPGVGDNLVRAYTRMVDLHKRLKHTAEILDTVLRLNRVKAVKANLLYRAGRDGVVHASKEQVASQRKHLLDLAIELFRAAQAGGFAEAATFSREVPLDLLSQHPGGPELLRALGVKSGAMK